MKILRFNVRSKTDKSQFCAIRNNKIKSQIIKTKIKHRIKDPKKNSRGVREISLPLPV